MSRLNEQFIDVLDQLANIMLKRGEPFRARAYQKAQETIYSMIDHNILSPQDLKGKPGIGDTIMDKLQEYTNTGTLRILEEERHSPVNILSDIYGVGPKKAKELVDKGILSISQLRENQQLLNDVQRIGLRYYEDILKRIPREEIEVYKTIFERALEPSAKMEIVGSYRRGQPSSGDIDVILTSTSPSSFIHFVDKLLATGVIIHVLSRGPSKCLVITKLSNNSCSRRVDFLFTSPDEFPFAILYFTGSKIFNTVMRQVAVDQGFSMNEHGITHGKKGTKVAHQFTCEADIFAFLGLEYKEPRERIDGRAIRKKDRQAWESNIGKNLVHLLRNQGPHTLTESQLREILREANDAYHNKGNPILSDTEFDMLQDYVQKKFSIDPTVGAPVPKSTKTKVPLPYFMGSMDKIKPDTNALAGWCAKYRGPYVISCKLDGVSGLYSTEDKEPKLYTRGDGSVGQDISHLIPYLRLPQKKGIVIRGEFILPRSLFETKYKTTFSNPRNMVAGIVNHKTVHEAIQDVHFVAYEVIQPACNASKQIELLASLNVEVVQCQRVPHLNNDFLSNILQDWRSTYMYEIDGIIVTDDGRPYERTDGNPAHAFAFKMVLTDQVVEATVVDVLWSASKDGYLKPRVQIEPVQLGGVQITYATGFNGAFIEQNRIGIGAVVELIRSGDVIPYIRSIRVPAAKPKMPDVPFTWNDTHVDIQLEDIDSNETVREKNITGFFRGIGVEGLSTGNVKRLMETGFDSVPKILAMNVSDFLKVDGFKDKTASKLHDGIAAKMQEANLITLMSASNMFGRGFSEKKLELIIESYPHVLTEKISANQKVSRIASIKGFQTKTAEAFVERIPAFIDFLHACGKDPNSISASSITSNHVLSSPSNQDHPLYGKTVVMTGFRDDHLQTYLKQVGCKVGSSVSSKTFAVIVKDGDVDETGKVADAKRCQVPLIPISAFRSKYL